MSTSTITPLPLILYDIDNQVIPINFISKSNTFFIRSYQLFSVKLHTENLEDKIFSVIRNQKTNDFQIDESNQFINDENFSYTLYIQNNVIIEIFNQNNQESVYYHLEYKPDNLFINDNEYYNDLLINNNLPKYDELLPAIIDSNKADIIKRMLLDFKYIIKNKGKKSGIQKFLNFIGFNPDSIKLYEEYSTENNTLTITPNKLVDSKTGNYHLLYDNYEYVTDNKYTTKNLPNIINTITDLDEFFKKLWYAISLANKYFTLPEQDITFFGMSNMSNSERYLSIAGNSNMIQKFDVHNFRKSIFINAINFSNDGLYKNYLIKNNLLVNDNQLLSEVKYYNTIPLNNNELFKIEDEVFDNTQTNYDEFNISRKFGNIIHLNIKVKDCYVEYVIEKIDNQLVTIKNDKEYSTVNREINITYLATKKGDYRITIMIYDNHNNREKYVYDYHVDVDFNSFDFDIFNSTQLITEDNNISLDIESKFNVTTPSNITTEILSLNLIPNDLSLYNTIHDTTSKLINNRINDNGPHRYELEPLNKNFVVNKSTEIPINFVDNFLHLLTYVYDVNKRLVIRTYDINGKPVYHNYSSNNFGFKDNELFVSILDIEENNVITPWVIITTLNPGIQLTQNVYDLGLIDISVPNNIDYNSFVSLFDEPTLLQSKLPLNYHIDLFHRESLIIPTFIYHPVTVNNIVTRIHSLYPKLIDITSPDKTVDTYQVKLGDIILCRINDNQLVDITDIKWTLINEFTGEILHKSVDYMLKYRVNQYTIFSVKLEFKIDGENCIIYKKSKQSSFIN